MSTRKTERQTLVRQTGRQCHLEQRTEVKVPCRVREKQRLEWFCPLRSAHPTAPPLAMNVFQTRYMVFHMWAVCNGG
jgi:hypothetical protein